MSDGIASGVDFAASWATAASPPSTPRGHPRATTRVRAVWFAGGRRGSTVVRGARRGGGDGRRVLPARPVRPLGEVWIGGREVPGERFPERHAGARRAATRAGGIRIARRGELPERPQGDLLQAGPLLVDDARVVFDAAGRRGLQRRPEQFDSDITAAGIRARALGLSADGEGHRRGLRRPPLRGRRGPDDGRAGDDGCSTSARPRPSTWTAAARRRSSTAAICSTRPYSEQDQPAPESRPIVTALLFDPA